MLPDISLIISTYNWPSALDVCIRSVLAQTVLPKEIVIADDGSREDTRLLIRNFQAMTSIPIIHVWQEDLGFRLAEIRNKAIAQCRYEYIVQIDGDLILDKHFIQDHQKFARPQSFVSGSRVLVNKMRSQQLMQEQRVDISIFSPGLKNRLNGMRIPFLSHFQENYRQDDIIYVRGCNMAFWRTDLLHVNGYNEEIQGWGREDNELACRLNNIQVRKRIIKFAAIAYHLWHSQQSRNSVSQNDEILKRTIENGLARCKRGLDNHI